MNIFLCILRASIKICIEIKFVKEMLFHLLHFFLLGKGGRPVTDSPRLWKSRETVLRESGFRTQISVSANISSMERSRKKFVQSQIHRTNSFEACNINHWCHRRRTGLHPQRKYFFFDMSLNRKIICVSFVTKTRRSIWRKKKYCFFIFPLFFLLYANTKKNCWRKKEEKINFVYTRKSSKKFNLIVHKMLRKWLLHFHDKKIKGWTMIITKANHHLNRH